MTAPDRSSQVGEGADGHSQRARNVSSGPSPARRVAVRVPTYGGSGPPPPRPPDDSSAERKLAAKRYNEGIKLVVSSLNTLGLTIFLATIVQPLVADALQFVIEYRPVWYFVGIGLHVVAQVILRFEYRSEE